MAMKDHIELVRENSGPVNWATIFILVLLFSSFWLICFCLQQYPYWILWIPAFLVVGGIQHHLAILMHEGAHFLLHTKRSINDGIGQGFCAFPLGMHLKDYRYFHLQHHKFTGDPEEDPEFAYYQKSQVGCGFKNKTILKHFFLDLFLWNTINSIIYLSKFLDKKVKEGKIRKLQLSDFVWGGSGLACLFFAPYLFGVLKIAIILWVVSAVFITPIFIRWHAIGEHTGKNPSEEYQKTMTHLLPAWINFFFYPLNSGLHLEHHLYPSVPWYRIKYLRHKLMQDPQYAQNAEELTVDGLILGNKTVLKVVFHGQLD